MFWFFRRKTTSKFLRLRHFCLTRTQKILSHKISEKKTCGHLGINFSKDQSSIQELVTTFTSSILTKYFFKSIVSQSSLGLKSILKIPGVELGTFRCAFSRFLKNYRKFWYQLWNLRSKFFDCFKFKRDWDL